MQYDQIIKIVQTIIDSLTNVAVAHLNGLKDYLSRSVFSVKVTNPTTETKVTGTVEVANMSPLLKAVSGLVFAINGLKKPLMAKKDVIITNFKDLKLPEFPKKIEIANPQKEVKITNMKEFSDAIEKIAEFLAKVKYDPRIEVNPTPVNVKAPVVNVAAPVIHVPKQEPPIINIEKPDLSDISRLLDFFEGVGAKKPLAVRLSDGKSFYKALEKMADIYAGSSFSAYQDSTGADARAMVNARNEVRVTVSDTWDANDVDRVSSTLTRFGEETADGTWRIREVTKTGTITSIRHATSRNNPDINGYESAWTERETLSYGYAREAL